jgi:exosortase B
MSSTTPWFDEKWSLSLHRMIAWSPVILGLAALYLPTLYDLFTGVWKEDEQAHGPIILAISCWLLFRKSEDFFSETSAKPSKALGWTSVTFALLSYCLGRSQAIIQLEVGSIIPLLVGLILLTRGKSGLVKLWFPLFFMLFMVPLPGVFVQALTIPLKTAVSIVAEQILYWANYPISRTGVILQVGQYQMLVADACAGMHTLFTLEALGLLYMNLAGHTSAKRNILLAVLIVPISFTANVIRVLILILITFYFGDEAGQGFLHGFAGMTLFLSALLLIIGVDTLLGKYLKGTQ